MFLDTQSSHKGKDTWCQSSVCWVLTVSPKPCPHLQQCWCLIRQATSQQPIERSRWAVRGHRGQVCSRRWGGLALLQQLLSLLLVAVVLSACQAGCLSGCSCCWLCGRLLPRAGRSCTESGLQTRRHCRCERLGVCAGLHPHTAVHCLRLKLPLLCRPNGHSSSCSAGSRLLPLARALLLLLLLAGQLLLAFLLPPLQMLQLTKPLPGFGQVW